MKLVTNTELLTDRLSYAEAVRMIAEAGFDGVDCSFFGMKHPNDVWCTDGWKALAVELKTVAEDHGVVFRQAHAPFPTAIGQEPYDTEIRQKILRAMEAAAILGVENIVVHPIHYTGYVKDREGQYRRSLEFYRGLIPYCEEFGIRVCTENMWEFDPAHVIRDSLCARPEEFCSLVDEIGSPWIGACLDIGHAALVGQDPANMIRRMGKHITCLHVHDVDYRVDRHTLPFTQELDWEGIAKALGEVEYRGDFTYEIATFLGKMPQDLWADCLKIMERVGRYLIRRIEENYPAAE